VTVTRFLSKIVQMPRHNTLVRPVVASAHTSPMRKLAMPNILMFADRAWVNKYTERQLARLPTWLHRRLRRVVLEMAAGKSIANRPPF
jgi:hypothetical protein